MTRIEMEFRIYLAPLKEFAKIMEKALKKSTKEFGKKIHKKKYIREDWKKFNLAKYEEMKNEYPQVLRYSFLLMCISRFEHIMLEACARMKKSRECPIDVTDLSGNNLDKIKLYFLKVLGNPLPTKNQSWNQIRNLYSIRNFIIHRNGILDDSRKGHEVRKFIEKTQMISVKSNKIILDERFLKCYLAVFEDFFHNVHRKYEK